MSDQAFVEAVLRYAGIDVDSDAIAEVEVVERENGPRTVMLRLRPSAQEVRVVIRQAV